MDPKSLYVVSVMPCTAKKYEIQRPEMKNGENWNVDAVLTTRELARMIKTAGIDFASLEDEAFDDPMGISSGAGGIFGVTGGGQPRIDMEEYRELRAGALYSEDERKNLRMSHENPAVTQLYAEYLGSPCGEKSHHLLHTTYTPRGQFNELLELSV